MKTIRLLFRDDMARAIIEGRKTVILEIERMNDQHIEPPAGRKPVEHQLKTWSPYFAAIQSGAKTFELRRNDRDFQVGDVLILRETDQLSGAPSGRECRRVVTYKLDRFSGLVDEWCVLGIAVDAEG